MNLNSLNAISPVDGRYWNQCQELSEYFSESALIRYRLLVEVEYFIALLPMVASPKSSLPEKIGTGKKNGEKPESLRKLYQESSENYALEIKEIEKTTNHDVKALEYFLKKKLEESGLGQCKEFVHFGLTSQDINNTAFPLAIKSYINAVHLPLLTSVVEKLQQLSKNWKDIAMLSRTHGQPASPTRLGKEMNVFIERLNNQIELLKQIPFSAKFGGASGNFNAHHVAYPDVDWKKFADDFCSQLPSGGLKRLQFTTQIEHYDNLCALFDTIKRINNILIDLNRDLWTYISMDYFGLEIKVGEIGSSAMPHKVNPIDFENSEGNLGVANSLFEHLSSKLPISRLQRDLTDSTVLRNVGVPFAHSVIALKSLLKGLAKLQPNKEVIEADLENNWAVVAEGIQTILRKENYPEPYEKLKELTRTNKKITQQTISKFIDSLDVSDGVKKKLRGITPFNYTGI
jgi:adenylosuccinate lyase